MQSHQKNNVTTKFFTRDYSKRLYKATYENYLSDEGITVFENSKKELIEKAKKFEEMLPVIND